MHLAKFTEHRMAASRRQQLVRFDPVASFTALLTGASTVELHHRGGIERLAAKYIQLLHLSFANWRGDSVSDAD